MEEKVFYEMELRYIFEYLIKDFSESILKGMKILTISGNEIAIQINKRDYVNLIDFACVETSFTGTSLRRVEEFFQKNVDLYTELILDDKKAYFGKEEE